MGRTARREACGVRRLGEGDAPMVSLCALRSCAAPLYRAECVRVFCAAGAAAVLVVGVSRASKKKCTGPVVGASVGASQARAPEVATYGAFLGSLFLFCSLPPIYMFTTDRSEWHACRMTTVWAWLGRLRAADCRWTSRPGAVLKRACKDIYIASLLAGWLTGFDGIRIRIVRIWVGGWRAALGARCSRWACAPPERD